VKVCPIAPAEADEGDIVARPDPSATETTLTIGEEVISSSGEVLSFLALITNL